MFFGYILVHNNMNDAIKTVENISAIDLLIQLLNFTLNISNLFFCGVKKERDIKGTEK